MTDRRLLMLESYYSINSDKQKWRLTNPPGLPFHDDVDQFAFVRPADCRPGVIDEVSKVISLLAGRDEW